MGGYLLFVYLTLPLLPPAVKWTRENWGDGPIAVVGPGLSGFLALWFAVLLVRRRGWGGGLGRLAALLALSLAVLIWKGRNPVEQIHLVEYGVVGFLALRAAREGGGGLGRRAAWATAALLSGIVDELIQALLPNRVCDPTDMAVNVLSVTVGWGAAAALGTATGAATAPREEPASARRFDERPADE